MLLFYLNFLSWKHQFNGSVCLPEYLHDYLHSWLLLETDGESIHVETLGSKRHYLYYMYRLFMFGKPIHVQTLGSKRHYLTENQEALETNSTLQ